MTIRIIGLVLVVLVLAVGYQLWVNQGYTEVNDVDAQPDADAPEANEEQWPHYTDESFPFTFSYPPDANVGEENERVKVTYLGPDNTMGSEITDGFTVFIGTLSESDPEEAAATWLTEEEELGTALEPVEPVSIAGYDGYRFVVETGLGTEATHYVLATEGADLLTLSYTVIDPHERGYDTMVEHIVLTLQL